MNRTRLRTALIGGLLPLALAACHAMPASAQAGAAGANRFDLTGPRIDVHVQRGDKSLPIALVPNLLPKDKITIHADLPNTQSVHLLLVVAFLRGSTNPPPDSWFTAVKTWDKKANREGVTVTVPDEAQQALFFLAPETGGDYSTLKSAVTGRPGVFVRAAQDLNEASFEQARIERYLQLIRMVPPGSPDELVDHSKKLAATLNLKPNDACFKQPPEQQLSCLRQSGTQLLLDDGHGQTLAAMLSNGDPASLIAATASTPMMNTGGMNYSAYVGTVIDLVRLMSGLHTAQFQYIPAIAFPDDEALNLRLNTPPSFHNPKSVIVVALPAIKQSTPPPLRLQDSGHVSCLLQPSMVLPLEGAPLVYATSFAHDLTLHLNSGTLNGLTDIPLKPSAFDGGLVVALDDKDRKPLPVSAPEARDSADNPTGMRAAEANKSADKVAKPAAPTAKATDDASGDILTTGTLVGKWGFDSFQGVTVPLQRRSGTGWGINQHAPLIAGRSNDLQLHADGTACASQIDLDLPGDKDLKLGWQQVGADAVKPDAPRPLAVKLPLEKVNPGTIDLLVHQYGTDAVTRVNVTAYSDATRPAALRIHAGDNFGVLTGTGLSGVASVKLAGVEYKRVSDQQPNEKELRLLAAAAPPKDSKGKGPLTTPGETGTADVILSDGRTMPVPYTVEGARPAVTLLNKTAKPEQTNGLPLNLNGKDDLPLNARITFALRSESPARFPRGEKVEVALTDGSLHATMDMREGSLVLQDARTALAFFSPAKAFGPSAFGPLQIRAVGEDGTAGDWIPVGTLVRTPTITAITCTRPTHAQATAAAKPQPGTDPANSGKPSGDQTAASPALNSGCQITGNDLFLIDSVAADSNFTDPTPVPLGFAGDTLSIPRPTDNRTLYLKLRDDNTATFTVTNPTPLTASTAPHRSAPTPPAASPAAPTPTATDPAPAGQAQ